MPLKPRAALEAVRSLVSRPDDELTATSDCSMPRRPGPAANRHPAAGPSSEGGGAGGPDEPLPFEVRHQLDRFQSTGVLSSQARNQTRRTRSAPTFATCSRNCSRSWSQRPRRPRRCPRGDPEHSSGLRTVRVAQASTQRVQLRVGPVQRIPGRPLQRTNDERAERRHRAVAGMVSTQATKDVACHAPADGAEPSCCPSPHHRPETTWVVLTGSASCVAP